ncbi:MAG: hypothetical protein ACI4XM_02015 [Candidatus Coprovivens sp.]
MQNKKTTIIFLIITIILIITSIAININTIYQAKERIITNINETTTNIEETNNVENQDKSEEEIEKSTTIIDTSNKYTKKELIIIIITSIIITICLLNLIVTKFGTISLSQSLNTSKKLIYYSIILVILSTTSTIYTITTTDNKILNGDDTKKIDEKSVAIIEITENKTDNSLSKESQIEDTSVIQITNSAEYIGNKLELLKSKGNTTDKESSLYYGLNSAFLAKDSSVVELNNSYIATGVDYSAALFASGLNTQVTLNNTRLTTYGNNSPSISVSTASIIASDIELSTSKDNSPAINILNNNSKIQIKDSLLNTYGQNSPIIYNKGQITADNITATTSNSNIINMNSTNNLTITNSELKTLRKKEEPSSSAIYLFTELNKYERVNYTNSFVSIEDSTLIIDKESPSYKELPLFYITNIDVNINLSNTQIKYGSNILFQITGNNQYGEIGDNGGNVIFTATDQTLKGNILLDEQSSIAIYLNNSNYKGQINPDNNSKNVDIVLDKTTKWELTGDSYIRTLTLQNGQISRLKKQIKSNNHNIYYNAYQNDWLEGKTIKLDGGGRLIPIYES